jgi:hypothetical protein
MSPTVRLSCRGTHERHARAAYVYGPRAEAKMHGQRCMGKDAWAKMHGQRCMGKDKHIWVAPLPGAIGVMLPYQRKQRQWHSVWHAVGGGSG